MLSKSVGCCDAATAELLALKEAIYLFCDSLWARSFMMLLETDCAMCVEWFNHPNSAPTAFMSIIADCLKGCSDLSWSIHAIPRATNVSADKLAKSGILL
ncbi:hypothetical protein V6N11_043092 [Hibiscus sabdariffa]|uniref:RNase H type-1 domain-containing protein n=1 Tax=Hibiscus sabdariffa TaxID=183260 RepID=A0ABR2QYA0_9ROSI